MARPRIPYVCDRCRADHDSRRRLCASCRSELRSVYYQPHHGQPYQPEWVRVVLSRRSSERSVKLPTTPTETPKPAPPPTKGVR